MFFDAGEWALGKAGSPKGTATLNDLEKLGAEVVGKVTGCDPADLKKQLEDYHQKQGLSGSEKLRADPFGKARSLDPSKMGTGKNTTTGF